MFDSVFVFSLSLIEGAYQKVNKTEQKPGPVGMMKVHSKILRK